MPTIALTALFAGDLLAARARFRESREVVAQAYRRPPKTDSCLPGGRLDIAWEPDGHVYMSGPAVEIFSGTWEATT